jgi:hypothetical protein
MPIFPSIERQQGITFTSGFPLSEVDAEELTEMCDVFREAVFNKAGKKDPKLIRNPR